MRRYSVAGIGDETERTSRSIATALVGLSLWSVSVSAHGTGAHAGSQGSAGPVIPFAVAIGLSALLGLTFGLGAVSRYRSDSTVGSARGATRTEVTALLIVLGLAALFAALSRDVLPTIGGGTLGAALALAARTRGVSPHAGCADAALGAILTHRVVEGALIAGIYATSVSFGLMALALLTVHAVAESVAVGGLYGPVGRNWGVASVVAVQSAFVVGAVGGGLLLGFLTPTIVTVLLASVGGVLFLAGTTEIRSVASRAPAHLET
ncbi:hypothetical protein [Natrinema sp. 1APR25-10V2]|uniref:hypothetical protein n=1 Tax=Natrinema sp. 1APR25-10V2 TaxID=2951081 RepID=UPI00287417B9|nr:hypothetical protein [Natrinema sp. 1APR25-10V2]MDS0478512.1 hypothetical protein [Natrinema sp. 1APR25-10V2]